MKKIFNYVFMSLVMLMVSVSFSSCNTATPDAGQEAVFVKKPILFFWTSGVDDVPAKTGLEYCAWTTDVVYVTMTPVAYDEHIEDSYSNDNTQLDWDIQIILQVIEGKSPVLIKNYGPDWYKNNIHKEVTSHFFNLVGNYSPFDLMSNRSVTDSIQVLMKKHMTNYINQLSKNKELPIIVNNFICGKARPNEKMRVEMDNTAAAIQASKTQEQKLAYEQKREATERQRALADKAYMNAMNLSGEQFIQLKYIELIAEKKDANIDVLVGTGSNPMWNIRR